MNANYGGFSDYIKLFFNIFNTVGNRVKIGHGAHIGISPAGCRKGACPYGFFIKKSRFSEMHMHIAKSRKNIYI